MTIGLFGTCGGSTWRNEFVELYDATGIEYYNPQVLNWKLEDAKIEAEHLANDDVILFPILAETEGLGSLAEVGFSIIQIIKSGGTKNIIVMIDDDCTVKDVAVREASIRMRALVKAHLKKLNYPNVYLVDYLIDMYKLSLELHAIETLRAGLDQYRAK